MSQFESIEEFHSVLDSFKANEFTVEALPMLLSHEIFGIQFALECNWLKELGMYGYAKPDVHLRKVFSALGVCEDDDISCFKAIRRISQKCNVSSYAMDKIVWLICSGVYYRQGALKLNQGNLRERFINEIQKYTWNK